MAQDVILETLDALITLVRANGGVFLPQHRGEAERIARAAWAGERPYIAKLGEEGQRQMSQRDQTIRREARRGVSLQVLARRHGISLRRAQYIVQGEKQEAAAPAEPTAQAIAAQPGAAPCLTGGAGLPDAAALQPPRTRRPAKATG